MAIYKLYNDIAVFGELESSEALEQIKTVKNSGFMTYCKKAAMMADHHLGYHMPIGGVAAYRKNHIFVSGVGFDIACGNKAVKLDISAEDVLSNISTIMDDIYKNISFGVGRVNNEEVEHKIADDSRWKLIEFVLEKSEYLNKSFDKKKALAQLGTVGSGNHFVDLFIDDAGAVWIGVHFGSRGLGHKLTTHFMSRYENPGNTVLRIGNSIDAEEVPYGLGLYSGDAYYHAMNFCGDYAYAGRDWVCNKIAKDILGANIIDEVHNHHNFAWIENHHEIGEVMVVRKGATPAFPGQRGFVGGSMGDNSVILEGVESDIGKKLTMYSTVHGAGRVMGRREAAGKFKWKREKEGERKKLVRISEGKISKQMLDDWLNDEIRLPLGVELRGGGLDEAPQAYKRLDDVLKAHEGTIKILNTLRPIGVAMAGSNEFDPYKD